MYKIAAAVAAVVLLGLVLVTCSSTTSTGPDEQALHYKDGPVSSKKFADCIKPSTRVWDGAFDAHYTYPAGQRTYSFTGRKGSESDAVTIKTSDAQELTVKGFVTFALTQDCDALRKFHESVGSKYEAYEPDGWRDFLGDYLAVPLNSSMDKAALEFDWRTLYSSNEALTEFEAAVKESLPNEVQAALGEEFLTIKSVSIETPLPSSALREGLESKEKAILDNDAQKERNETLRTQYDSFRDCKAVLTEESCLILKLAEQGSIPLYPIPAGGAINVQPGADQ